MNHKAALIILIMIIIRINPILPYIMLYDLFDYLFNYIELAGKRKSRKYLEETFLVHSTKLEFNEKFNPLFKLFCIHSSQSF